MKVAFLTSYDKNSPYQWSLPPLGIGYLSSYAKQQCWFAETVFHPRIDDLLKEDKPDVVAISSTTENFQQARDDAKAVRDMWGDIPIILGGMHITSLPHALPKEFTVGAVGEGEETFADLLKLFHAKKRPDTSDFAAIPGVSYHENGGVLQGPIRNSIKELDTLPYPDRETIDKGWALRPDDQIHMVSSRGCPYRCSFCSSAKHWKTFRFFSAEYVAKEIEYLREKYNPEIVYFFDDLFIGHIGRWREVVKIFRERGIHKGIRFRAYARVDLVTEEMAEQFAELNFKYIDFGFESNSERILKYLTKTRVTPGVNQRAVDWLSKNGISIGGNFIIGSPLETKADLEETYQFAYVNKDKFDRSSVGPLQPLPGTAVWAEAVAKGLVDENMDWSRLGVGYNNFSFERFPFMGESISPGDFMQMYDKFHTLTKEINYVGQIRRLIDQKSTREGRIRELESELAKLRGSRVVQAALKVRDWKSELFGAADGVEAKKDDQAGKGPGDQPPTPPTAGNGTGDQTTDQIKAQMGTHQAA